GRVGSGSPVQMHGSYDVIALESKVGSIEMNLPKLMFATSLHIPPDRGPRWQIWFKQIGLADPLRQAQGAGCLLHSTVSGRTQPLAERAEMGAAVHEGLADDRATAARARFALLPVGVQGVREVP